MSKSKDPTPEEMGSNFSSYMSWLYIISVAINLVFIAIFFSLDAPFLIIFTTVMTVAYFVFAWRFEDPVGPNQIAVLLFFGKPLKIVDSGPPWAPRGVITPVKLPVDYEQYEFPAEPENIYRGELKEREKLPEGMKPPIRITFTKSLTSARAKKVFGEDRDLKVLNLQKVENSMICEFKGEDNPCEVNRDWSTWERSELEDLEKFIKDKYPDSPAVLTFETNVGSTDGLAMRNTQEIVFVVRWLVEKERAFSFIRLIGSEAEANRQMEDELVSVANRLLPKMSLAQALENIEWLNAHLFYSIIKRTSEWGIRIDNAYAKRFDLNHALNTAIAKASEAEFTGRAEKELLVKRGEGAAQAAQDLEEKTLLGRAAGLKGMATDLDISGEAAVNAEVAREFGKSGNAVIIGEDGLAKAVGLGSALLNKKGGKKDQGE